MYKLFFLFIMIIFQVTVGFAQQEEKNDTFFLAKKKGLLGRLGRSITRNPASVAPVKAADPFKPYNGKFIRLIEIIAVGFNQNLNDTTYIRTNLAIKIADKFHRNTRNAIIRKNLFFKEGDTFLPLLISDNERYLRELPYIRDAVIVVYQSIMSKDSVDVIVMTRDLFSIGGNFSANGFSKMKAEVRDENIAGTGSRFGVSALYDKNRNPNIGFGAEFIERNIKGSFLNVTIGLKTFRNAIVNNRYEELTGYLKIEKPLINRYTEWTGAFAISHNQSANAYLETDPYMYLSQYTYNNIDLWGGYNIGWGRQRRTDSEKRLRHFVASHAFYNYFQKVPMAFKDSFNYHYANLNGILFSYTLYKQNFYRTHFIYGFGRNEDVPIGISASVTGGWSNKQDRKRGYYAAEFDGSSYSKKGFFSSYIFKLGGFKGAGTFEDINLLLNVNHFTKLRQLSSQWYNRNFLSISYTRLYKKKLNEPLVLQSDFGLPYFRSDSLYVEADSRATLKVESVFFNLHKFLGFRFAPFVFTELSYLKPVINPMHTTNKYTAFGGGIRTRNENLVLGTVELRGFYFPRVTVASMSKWKIEFTANLKFKYNSAFVKKPDFVIAN